jgi:phosphoribosylanthranilate isomerase
MFQIKICGIMHRPDAIVAAALGADAIGLNFYEKSPRYLPPSLASNVAAAIPAGIAKVGVFVNATADEVVRQADRLRLDFIQLSGDETPEYLAALGNRQVIKAFRFSTDGGQPIAQFLVKARKLGRTPAAILVDAEKSGSYGGTGMTIDWTRLLEEMRTFDLADTPIVLAGGLTPENVAEAIAVARPQAVDVASGVEYAPGRKDADLVDRFIRAASAAFAQHDI